MIMYHEKMSKNIDFEPAKRQIRKLGLPGM